MSDTDYYKHQWTKESLGFELERSRRFTAFLNNLFDKTEDQEDLKEKVRLLEMITSDAITSIREFEEMLEQLLKRDLIK